MAPITNADVEVVLSRGLNWHVPARAIADAALVRLYEKIDKKYPESSAKRDLACSAAAVLYVRWLRQIEDGSFLLSFVPDRGPEAPPLNEQVLCYLTGQAFYLTLIGEREKQQAEPKMAGDLSEIEDGIADSGDVVDEEDIPALSPGIGETVLDPADMRTIREAIKRGQLPELQFNSTPGTVTQEWLTAVHMAWPHLSHTCRHEAAIRKEALKELAAPAKKNHRQPEGWLTQRSGIAQDALWQECQALQIELKKIQDAHDAAWINFIRTQETRQEGGDPARLHRYREDLERCEGRLLRTAMERYVMQFRPSDYGALFGRTKPNSMDYKRRERYKNLLAFIFVYGDRLSP